MSILFLKDVYPQDVILKPEAIVNFETDDSDTEPYENQEAKNEIIPQTYTGLANWPKSTNLRCWHCDCIYEERPITLPKSLDRVGTLNDGTAIFSMSIEGFFHSWACAAAYNENYSPSGTKEDRVNLLTRLFEDFNPGKTVTMIPSAEPKTVMKQWSGTFGMNPEDYYNECTKKLNPYITPKFTPNKNFVYG